MIEASEFGRYSEKKNVFYLVVGIVIAAVIFPIATILGGLSLMASGSCPSYGIADGRPICDPAVRSFVEWLAPGVAGVSIVLTVIIGTIFIRKQKSTGFLATAPAVLIVISVFVAWGIAGVDSSYTPEEQSRVAQQEKFASEVIGMMSLPTFEEYKAKYIALNTELRDAVSGASLGWDWPLTHTNDAQFIEPCHVTGAAEPQAFRVRNAKVVSGPIGLDMGEQAVQTVLPILQRHGYPTIEDSGPGTVVRSWAAVNQNDKSKLQLTFTSKPTPNADQIFVGFQSTCYLTAAAKAQQNSTGPK